MKNNMYRVSFDGMQIAWFFTAQDAFQFISKTYNSNQVYRATVSQIKQGE